MRIIKFLSIILLLTGVIVPQLNPGARQIALAHSDVAMANDVFTLFNNPAGLAQMDWREIGIFYSPSPFGLNELANGFAAYHQPTAFGSFALGLMTYGFDLYRENRISFAYSYNHKNIFFGGVVLNTHTLSIANYGNDVTLSFDIGALAYLSDDLKWGFVIKNFSRATFGDEKDQIPVILNSGFCYSLFQNLSLNFSIEKDLAYPESFNAGIEYDIIEYFSIRFGIASATSHYSAGVGINYSFLHLDYSLFTHPDLGFTHQAGVIIHFGSNESRADRIKKSLNK